LCRRSADLSNSPAASRAAHSRQRILRTHKSGPPVDDEAINAINSAMPAAAARKASAKRKRRRWDTAINASVVVFTVAIESPFYSLFCHEEAQLLNDTLHPLDTGVVYVVGLARLRSGIPF
jgi:hypothetical protein